MLDLPELFAPARMVKGRISIVCLVCIDLNPLTAILEMARLAVLDPTLEDIDAVQSFERSSSPARRVGVSDALVP